MSPLDALRLAIAQIRTQKLKSFFTLAGVMIGVMFLIAVVSIVGGMSRYMENEAVGKLIGVNSFTLRRAPNIQLGEVTPAQENEWRRRPAIRESDVTPVSEALPPGARWSVESSNQLKVESPFVRPRTVEVRAVSGDYFEIRKMTPVAGRVFSPQELAMGTPVVLIGRDIRTNFFPGVDPLGRALRIGGLPYTVVGVAEPQGSIFGLSLDKFVVAPFKSPVHRLLVREHGTVEGITVQTPSSAEMSEAMERVRQVMRSRHRLRPTQPDNFELETSESALAFWTKIKGYMIIAGVLLPLIGLVVGAIVIMNIMLVAVSERTREIGVRKSLGARRKDILAQFLIEAATLSTLGAALGIAFGVGLSQLIAAVTPLPAALAPWSLVVGVALGAGVGILAGVYPASRASLLDPITALRQE